MVDYEKLNVKPTTKKKLESIGTMKDTMDTIINKLINHYMNRFGEQHTKIQHDFHEKYKEEKQKEGLSTKDRKNRFDSTNRNYD